MESRNKHIRILFSIIVVLSVLGQGLMAQTAGTTGKSPVYRENVQASYYAEDYHGKTTANGETFNMNDFTAAHKTLPFGTYVEVTNRANGKSVIVRINDRGPFVEGREIDLSKAAATELGMLETGTAQVDIKLLFAAPEPVAVTVPAEKPAIPVTDTATSPAVTPSAADSTSLSIEKKTTSGPTSVPAEKKTAPASTVTDTAMPVTGTAIPEPEVTESAPEGKIAPAVTDGKLGEPGTATSSTAPVLEQTAAPVAEQPAAGPFWRIQVGAYTAEANAYNLVKKLRKAGLEPAYEKTEKVIRVVLPGIPDAKRAETEEILKKAGFTDYLVRREY
jgi:rare lipoprotein A